MKTRINWGTIALLIPFFMFCSFVPSINSKGTMLNARMDCNMLQGIVERSYSVYLPPSYYTHPEKDYSVLYLLHGGGCSHTDWENHGTINLLVDSLLTVAQKTEEVIIVCAEGNENNMIWFDAPHWKYESFFFEEFIPYIESTYRIRSTKEARSIAGFSMGGGAAVVYGLHRPEMFSAVYAMSAYLYRQELDFLKNDPSAEWRQQLVQEHNPIPTVLDASDEWIERWKGVEWIMDCGDADFTFEANQRFVRALSQQRIPYQFTIRDGGHDWNYWKGCIVRMLKAFY